MKKFRVLSDLHLDLEGNEELPINDPTIFTILCGDTSGNPEIGHAWISKNMTSGLIISGNHLPYNALDKTIQKQREDLAGKYSLNSPISYLDVETGIFSKEVDGILFIGTCMYSDMKISGPQNPTGDVNYNKIIAHNSMNDYAWGIKEIKYYLGTDNDPTYVHVTPTDYVSWFDNAYLKIDKLLDDNEKADLPKPVVLFTHFPLVKRIVQDSLYDGVNNNFASYCSDKEEWIKSHPSIKCYCCGHVHDVAPKSRSFNLLHADGSKCLVVNNARGYVSRCHDLNFNPNTFVNTDTWEIEQIPEADEIINDKKRRHDALLMRATWFF